MRVCACVWIAAETLCVRVDSVCQDQGVRPTREMKAAQAAVGGPEDPAVRSCLPPLPSLLPSPPLWWSPLFPHILLQLGGEEGGAGGGGWKRVTDKGEGLLEGAALHRHEPPKTPDRSPHLQPPPALPFRSSSPPPFCTMAERSGSFSASDKLNRWTDRQAAKPHSVPVLSLATEERAPSPADTLLVTVTRGLPRERRGR